MSKGEILEAVWPETRVAEGSLGALVKEVREALGEDAQTPASIRTVLGYGYAFDGTVHEAAPPAPSSRRHSLLWRGTELSLSEGENVIGREPPAMVVIPHPSISRRHARIEVEGDRALIEDLGSKNGTWLGSAKVKEMTALADGDELRIGGVHLTYRGPAATGPDRTAAFP